MNKFILYVLCQFVEALSNSTVPVSADTHVGSQVIHIIGDHDREDLVRQKGHYPFVRPRFGLLKLVKQVFSVRLFLRVSHFVGQSAFSIDFLFFDPLKIWFLRVGLWFWDISNNSIFFLLAKCLADNILILFLIREHSVGHTSEHFLPLLFRDRRRKVAKPWHDRSPWARSHWLVFELISSANRCVERVPILIWNL